MKKLTNTRIEAYSCLTTVHDGRMEFNYETGEKTGIETLTFAQFPLYWIE